MVYVDSGRSSWAVGDSLSTVASETRPFRHVARNVGGVG